MNFGLPISRSNGVAYRTPAMTDRSRKLSTRKRMLLIAYTAMIASWILDFKSDGAGQGLASQGIFGAFYVISAIAVAILNKLKIQGNSIFFLFVVTLNFLAIAMFVSSTLGQYSYNTTRNAIPIIIYITSAYASYCLILDMVDHLDVLRKFIGCAALTYMISTFIVVSMSKAGVDLDTVRYQIIGGSVVFGVSYAMMMMRFRLIFVETMVVFITIIIVALSVTRTWIVVFALEFFIMLAFSAKISRKLVFRLSVVGIILVIGVGALQLSGVPVLDRWSQRMLSNQFSVDPTLLSRDRQNNFMIESIAARPFFGSGLSGESEFWLEKSLGGSGSVSTAYGFGHNQHISLIFIGGFLGGGPLLLLQCWQLISAIKFMSRTRRSKETNLVFFGVLGGLVICGTMTYGMLGGTFGDRELTLWYGVGTGLFLATQAVRLRLARATTRLARTPMRGERPAEFAGRL